jgi:ABC-type dipeptide/oligopeptide/nickel transport system ATPase component
MDPPVLACDDLTVRFHLRRGTLTAVDGVSFSVRKGETFGLVGESGSGKTVTARAIMRLIPTPPGELAAGSVVLEGRSVYDLDERELRDIRGRRIAMVFQEPMSALNPVFTVRSQIGDVLRHRADSDFNFFMNSACGSRARLVGACPGGRWRIGVEPCSVRLDMAR